MKAIKSKLVSITKDIRASNHYINDDITPRIVQVLRDLTKEVETLQVKKSVETINKEQVKALIKEMIQDEEIQIVPLPHRNRHQDLSDITIQVFIDGDLIKET